MASSVPPILASLTSSIQTLSAFAFHAQKWDTLSAHLSDINSTLTAASLTLEAWQRKYDVQDRRPVLYMHVLFGQAGWERIERALESVHYVSRKVERARDDVVACTVRYGQGASQPPSSYDADAAIASLRHIARKPTRSQRFLHAALKRSAELEFQAFRLSRKLGVLERLSDLYLEAEHPDLFAPIKRLPGRRNLYLEGDERSESMIEGRVADAVSARKDAELLYRATLPASDRTPRSILRDKESEGADDEIDIEAIHVGLQVPTTHRRSFAFLLTTPHSLAHELLAHPVKIRSGNLPSTFSAALPQLLSAPPDSQDRIETYILPSPGHTSGFHLSLPPTPLFSGLEFKDPISTILTSRPPALSQQVLYPRDQAALACGITAGSFRLLTTTWADSIRSGGLRWMRTAEGGMNIILSSTPTSAPPKPRGLELRQQIFNIGVLVTEIALKTRLSLHPSAQSNDIYIFIPALDESKPIDAVEIAAEVERRTNVFIGNIVFFCLSALGERGADDAVDKMYCREVLGVVDELEEVMRREEPRTQGLSATPRRERERRGSRSNRSSVVYAY